MELWMLLLQMHLGKVGESKRVIRGVCVSTELLLNW